MILNVAPNLARDLRDTSLSFTIAKSAYFLFESMIVEGVFKINVSKKVAHGCEHTLADMVSIIFDSERHSNMDDCKKDLKHTLEIPLPPTIRHLRPPVLILQLRTNHQVRRPQQARHNE